MDTHRSRLAIQRDIMTDPRSTPAQRRAAGKALRNATTSKNKAVDRILARAQREKASTANPWLLYNELRNSLPPMPAHEYESVIQRLSSILDV